MLKKIMAFALLIQFSLLTLKSCKNLDQADSKLALEVQKLQNPEVKLYKFQYQQFPSYFTYFEFQDEEKELKSHLIFIYKVKTSDLLKFEKSMQISEKIYGKYQDITIELENKIQQDYQFYVKKIDCYI